MKRKVIQISDSTKLVSLPKKWTDANNVQKGDELNIEELDSSIIVSLNKRKKEKIRGSFDVSNFAKKELHTLVCLLYRVGYDEIELNFDKSSDVSDIQKMLNAMFLGYEIAEQSRNKCLLTNVSVEDETSFGHFLKRAFVVTLSLANSSLNHIEQHGVEHLSELVLLEQTNNKLVNYCQRILNTTKVAEYAPTSNIYVIVWQIESICDVYRDICNYLGGLDETNLDNEMIKYYSRTNALLKEYIDMFYNFDKEAFIALNKNIKSLKEDLSKEWHIDNHDKQIVYYLMDIVQRIKDCMSSTWMINLEI